MIYLDSLGHIESTIPSWLFWTIIFVSTALTIATALIENDGRIEIANVESDRGAIEFAEEGGQIGDG